MTRTGWGILSFLAGGVCLLIAVFTIMEWISVMAQYEQYCTGLAGVITEIGGGGQTCDDADLYLNFLTYIWIISGLIGVGFGILGIILLATSNNQQQVMYVPQTGVQYVQPHQVQNQYAPSHVQPYQVQNQYISPQTNQKPPPGY